MINDRLSIDNQWLSQDAKLRIIFKWAKNGPIKQHISETFATFASGNGVGHRAGAFSPGTVADEKGSR